jgi:hypothetical protein
MLVIISENIGALNLYMPKPIFIHLFTLLEGLESHISVTF